MSADHSSLARRAVMAALAARSEEIDVPDAAFVPASAVRVGFVAESDSGMGKAETAGNTPGDKESPCGTSATPGDSTRRATAFVCGEMSCKLIVGASGSLPDEPAVTTGVAAIGEAVESALAGATTCRRRSGSGERSDDIAGSSARATTLAERPTGSAAASIPALAEMDTEPIAADGDSATAPTASNPAPLPARCTTDGAVIARAATRITGASCSTTTPRAAERRNTRKSFPRWPPSAASPPSRTLIESMND